MSIAQCDKAVGKLVRAFTGKEITPDRAQKLQDRLYLAIRGVRQDVGEMMIRAFEAARDYWHEPSRFPTADYADIVRGLLIVGARETASSSFLVHGEAFATLSLQELAEIVPDSKCADAWVKVSKADKKSVLKTIVGAHDDYYDSAWGDWYVGKAPIKTVLPFARSALGARCRAAHLPDSQALLEAALTRDKKGALALELTRQAVGDAALTTALVRACGKGKGIAEIYARQFGVELANQRGEECVEAVISGLEELVQGHSESESQLAAAFAGHVASTWKLMAGTKASPAIEAQLVDFGVRVLRNAQSNERQERWFTSSTGAVLGSALTESGKISPQGALQLALALRASQTDADAGDALWTAGFNLGLRETGKPGTTVEFDPRRHEDMKGGLLRGDTTQVVRCGWVFGEAVLVRAQVEGMGRGSLH